MHRELEALGSIACLFPAGQHQTTTRSPFTVSSLGFWVPLLKWTTERRIGALVLTSLLDLDQGVARWAVAI